VVADFHVAAATAHPIAGVGLLDATRASPGARINAAMRHKRCGTGNIAANARKCGK
jgi:hypothetical protein